MKNQIKGLLSSDEIATFCAQIAMILKAGISVSEGISIMCEDIKNSEGEKILSEIQESVDMGEPFHMALSATQKFPNYVVDMTRIGEQSGRLDEVMDSLCEYYEREESIAKSVKSAVTYPLIMVSMMLLVIGILVTKVLPVFAEVYAQLGSVPSPFVQNVMSLGSVAVFYALIIVILIIILFLIWFFMGKSTKGRNAITRFKASFFMTKKISAKIASGRFASAMALTMSSGLDVEQSLAMVKKLVDNNFTHEKITKCQELTAQGSSFSDAILNAKIFSGVYSRMVAVGFKAGCADTVMKKLSERYEDEVDTQINKIISILEPTLVAVLSVVVGMILLSVMLPLMGIMSSIG
ncbi:MAG: type II secretion system F family protein [Oscillospiraceae bacterium]